MRILIFEPDHTGHRLQHIHMLARALVGISDQVTVALARDCPDSAEFKTHLSTLPDTVRLDPSLDPATGPPLQAARAKFKWLRRIITQTKPDHLYIPYADGLTQIASLARFLGVNPIRSGVQAEALLMRGGFAYPHTTLRGKASAALSLMAIKQAPWSIIHHLDPIPFESIQRRGGSLAARSRLMPEPVEPIEPLTPQAARQRLSLPPDGRYIGCLGLLNRRKGVDLLIRAFARARLPDNDRLLLIGRMTPHIRDILNTECAHLLHQDRIIQVDRYVSDKELHAGIAAMNVVATPYPRHIGSSGIVVRAAALGRPVLGSDFGWVGMATSRFGLGWTCNVLDQTAFTQTIERSLNGSDEFEMTPAGHRFVAFHTTQNFAASFTDSLRQRLSLPPAEGRVSWEWVLEACRS